MYAFSPVLVDPEPHLGARDPAGLDWHGSWDCTTTVTADADWDAPDGPDVEDDLDGELRALLDSVRRAPQAPLGPADQDPAADGPLALWSDAAIVAEAARLERLTRWATARGYQLIR